MQIKITALKSRLRHSEDFDAETSDFISSIENKLQCKLDFADLDDYNCDLKLIFIQTGGSEGLFIKNFEKLQAPYYLLTNGANNSLAASLEILTYLRQHGKDGEILHGGADYIAQRIRELTAISAVTKKLQNTRLGVIGKPSDWLISSVPDYAEVKKRLGITLVDIPIEEAERLAAETSVSKSDCKGYPEFKDGELQKACAITKALRKIVEKYSLDGFTIRCFDLLAPLKSTGCLALSEFNSEGITAACEGDIAAMISMHIVKLLTGKPSFQANPSQIDTENNGVVFAHCAVPLSMTESYKFDTHFESGIGVAIKGEMKQGDITVFRLSADLKRCFITRGEITANLDESNLCRTQIKTKLDKPVTEILTNPCGNHHVIAYGNFAESMQKLMNALLAK